MPDNKLEIDLNNIIQNAIGEKPFSVEKNFDNVMMQKAADIISGKREEISANYSMSQEDGDGDIDTEVSDEELDDILTDIDNEEETDEVIDDSQDEFEDQAEPDTEEETDVEEA